jgi:hypothetical protein
VIEAFDEKTQQRTQLALFPEQRPLPDYARSYGVQVRLRPWNYTARAVGTCWLACHLYEKLELDQFWKARLSNSRQGTCWHPILQTLVCYRLIDPGSAWRLHRLWFEKSAMGIRWGKIMH